jgi:hypothetical protein
MFDYSTMRDMIAKVRADDTVVLMDEAIKVLGRYETPGYMSLFEGTIGRSDSRNPEEIVSLWISDAKALLVNCLRLQGIMVKETIALSALTNLAEATRIITEHEDSETVLRHLESDAPDLEVYAEIIAMVSTISPEDVMDMVAEVPTMFRNIIRAQYKEYEEEDVADAQELNKIIEAYQKYKNTQWGVVDLMSDAMLMQIATIGLPFEAYVTDYNNRKQGSFTDPEGYADCARELFGYACLSVPGYENPYQRIKAGIDLITHDMAKQALLDIELTKIAGGYGK